MMSREKERKNSSVRETKTTRKSKSLSPPSTKRKTLLWLQGSLSQSKSRNNARKKKTRPRWKKNDFSRLKESP